MMEQDTGTADWSKTETRESSPQPQLLKKKLKSKRADHEIRKCMGNGRVRETVLKSYSCAWQKDILVHGRLHLTQNWMCFYSNILGWETKTCVSMKDITAISKQKTALVFPNAILVEVGDKKYGFTSFVHRDRSYKVLQLVWQNSQLQQPSSGEALKAQLARLSQGSQSQAGRRSKSSSFTGDSSDVENSSIISSTSPTHSPSHSQPSTPYTSHSHLPTPHANYSQPSTPQTATTHPLDVSDSGDAEGVDQVDGMLSFQSPSSTYGSEVLPFKTLTSTYASEYQSHSSTYSSDTASEKGSGKNSPTNSPKFQRHATSEDDSACSTDSNGTYLDSQPSTSNIRALNRSPSLITLKPSRSDVDAAPAQALLGGSPNYLHHWKRTLSAATLWQSLAIIAKPQHLAQICTPSRLINMLIILFIILLLLSTVSMVCQLSRVEPALQPYLGWQPWCSCNHAAANVLDSFTTPS